MRVEFERSGGFAGLEMTYHADTDELPQETAEDLLKLIEQSGFFDIEAGDVSATSSGPPDVFWYRLSVSEGDKRQSLSFNDMTVPSKLRPLLERLQKLSLDEKRRGR